MKYANAISSTNDYEKVQIMDATPSLNRFVFCPESEDFCAFKLFVSFIWRSLPLTESSILETSLLLVKVANCLLMICVHCSPILREKRTLPC